jgi:hypothetical protein
MYADQLSRWYELFPEDQLLVIFTELLDRSSEGTCDAVLRFLGCGAATHTLSRENVAPRASIADADRRFLEAQFVEPNARLARMLGQALPWPVASEGTSGP